MNDTVRRRTALGIVVAVCAAALPGCGSVNGAQPIKPDEYGDATALFETPSQESKKVDNGYEQPKLFFINESTGFLQGQSSNITKASTLEAARLAMRRLAAGVRVEPGRETFATALPKDTVIKVLRIDNRIVYLDLQASVTSPEQKPLAFGQIVLTATSINDIDKVQFQSNGQNTAAVLPKDKSQPERKTMEPVGQDDYGALLKVVKLPGPGNVVNVDPTASPTPTGG